MKIGDDDLKKALAGMKKTEWELPAGFADQVMARVRRERRRPPWLLLAAAAAVVVTAVVLRAAWSPPPEVEAPRVARESAPAGDSGRIPARDDLRELEALREEYRLLLRDLERTRMLSNEPMVPFGVHDDLDLFLDVQSLWEHPPPSFSGERVIPVSRRER